MNHDRENALLVLRNGEKMHKIAMPFMVLLLVGFPLLLIICAVFFLIGDAQYLPLYFALCGYDGFLTGVFGLCYGFIGLGIMALPFYLTGLHLIGLGQIALNTTKQAQNPAFEPVPVYAPAEDILNYQPEMPAPVAAPVPNPAPVAPAPQPAFAPSLQDPIAIPQPMPAPAPAPVYEQEFVSAQQPQPVYAPPAPAKPVVPKCSKTLYNGLRKAAESTDDRDMIDILERTAAKLSVESERKLIRQIMNCPSARLRQVVDRVFNEISGGNV